MSAKRFLTILITLAVFAVAIYLIVSSILTTHSTGILDITTSDPNATLAVSSNNHQSQYLGLDHARVRLSPGTYLVSASSGSNIDMTSVSVKKQEITSTTLNINQVTASNNQYNQVIAKLPVTGPASEYTINYVLSYTNGQLLPILVISSTSEASKQAALGWFNYYHFNINNYRVEYRSLAPLPTSYNYF
jgi:hypothetical protein